MSQNGRLNLHNLVVGILILSFSFINILIANELIIRDENEDIIILISDDGTIESSIKIEENATTTHTSDDDLIIRTEDAVQNQMLITASSIKIKGTKVKHDDVDTELDDGLYFRDSEGETDRQVQAAVTETNGNFVSRGEVTDDFFSLEPNYVKTYVYKSDGDPSPITTADYSDGFGRSLQSQLMTSKTRAIVTGSYYDEFNRPTKVPKSINLLTCGKYYTMENEHLLDKVNEHYVKKYPEEGAFAYSETKYYNEPLSRKIEIGTLGQEYSVHSEHHSKIWYYGIDAFNATGNRGYVFPISEDIDFHGMIIPAGQYQMNTRDGFMVKEYINDINLSAFAYNRIDCQNDYYITVTKDPNGNYTQSLKDKFGNLLRTWAHDGNSEIVTNNEYNILGQVTKIIPPNQNVAPKESRFNSLGSLADEWSPDKNTTQYFYNNIGVLEKVVKANGVTLLYEFDYLDRIKKVKEEVLDEEIVRIRNFYDNTDFIEQELQPVEHLTTILNELHCMKGNLVAEVVFNEIENGQVVNCYSYNDKSQVEAIYKHIPGMSWQKVEFTYDILNNITSETVHPNYLSGEVIDPIVTKYKYNKHNLTSAVQNESNRNLISFDYSSSNQLIKKYYHNPDNGSITATLNSSYNIRDIVTEFHAYNNVHDITESRENIHFNGLYNGTITGMDVSYHNNEEQITLNYNYDNIYRLKGVVADAQHPLLNEGFIYDQNGRIYNKVKGSSDIETDDQDYIYQTCTYDGATLETNKLDQIISKHASPYNYGYDESGNMIANVHKEMQITYDWRDMPVYIEMRPESGDFVQVRMLYDASGNRVMKKVKTTTNAISTAYVEGKLVYHNDDYEDENESYQLLYATLGSDGRINYYGTNKEIYYYLMDHLGSTRSVINAKGEQIAAYAYTAYGETVPVAVDALQYKMRIRELFSGKEFDNEGYDENEQLAGVGFYYFGARFYDPEIGTWISTDPAGQFVNSYSYCGADPVNYIDPTGEFSWLGFGIGAGIGGVLGLGIGYAATGDWGKAFAISLGTSLAGGLIGGFGASGNFAESGNPPPDWMVKDGPLEPVTQTAKATPSMSPSDIKPTTPTSLKPDNLDLIWQYQTLNQQWNAYYAANIIEHTAGFYDVAANVVTAAQSAFNIAQTFLGQNRYSNLCNQFVRACYPNQLEGVRFANDFELYPNVDQITNPNPGDIVQLDRGTGGRPHGHVAIYQGNNRMITTTRGRIRILRINDPGFSPHTAILRYLRVR